MKKGRGPDVSGIREFPNPREKDLVLVNGERSGAYADGRGNHDA